MLRFENLIYHRLVSTVHATLTTILPVYILLTDDDLWANKVK